MAETWDLEYDVGYDLVDPRARVPDMERMRGRDPLHRPAVTRPSEMVEDLPLSVLATRYAREGMLPLAH